MSRVADEELRASIDDLTRIVRDLVTELRAARGPRPLLMVDEVQAILRIGRTLVLDLLKSGALPSVQVGEARTRRVRADDLDEYMAKLPQIPGGSLDEARQP